MMNDKALREQLVNLLTKDNAHITLDDAVKDAPASAHGQRAPGQPHTPWELLEHLRIAQWDIVEFTRNPKHESPEFPAGYWPKESAPPNASAWNESVEAFRKDLEAMVEITNTAPDLFATLPHGTGQTVLREILVLADHNAYHIGQLVVALKANS